METRWDGILSAKCPVFTGLQGWLGCYFTFCLQNVRLLGLLRTDYGKLHSNDPIVMQADYGKLFLNDPLASKSLDLVKRVPVDPPRLQVGKL